MDPISAAPRATAHQAEKLVPLRSCEKVALAYFTYLPCLGVVRHFTIGPLLILAFIPAVLWVMWQAVLRWDHKLVGLARDWCAPNLLLLGYWAAGWFVAPSWSSLQDVLVRLDHLFLCGMHVRALIEAAGPFLPAMLETIYIFLWTLPFVCMGILYACGERAQASRFLLLVFAGTFTVDALMPFFPLLPPRTAFPHADLPHYNGIIRSFNIWFLDHLDYPTTTLPSGHVAVAFSCAVGMVAVLRRRPMVGRCFLGLAGLIWLATIYGRYHYGADGLLSILLVLGVSGLVRALQPS
jgi:hypothetical protein